MRLSKQDKEVLIYSGLTAITLLLFGMIFKINNRGNSFSESPRLLPLIVVICMMLLCLVGMLRALKSNGRPTFAKISGSFKAACADEKVRSTTLAIVIVALYIFAGIPLLGFYLSSFLLICGITLGYVRRIKPIWAIVISLALTGLLYLIFAVAFNLRLR